MEVKERIAKVETEMDMHIESYKRLCESNKEEHKAIFENLDKANVQLSKIELLMTNHLAHHQTTEKRMFLLFLSFLSMLIPTVGLIFHAGGVI